MHQRVTSFLALALAIGAGCVPSASNSPNNGSSSGGNGSSNNGSGGNGSSNNGSGGNGSSNNGSGGNGSSSNGSGGKNSSGSSSGGSGSSSNGSGGSGSSGSGSGGTSGGSACVPDVSNLVNTTGLVCALDTAAMMQGSFYAYGDSMSCTIPSGPYNPCTDKGCCIKGTTTISDDTTMYKNWGCGLGMSLNTPPGTNPTKAAYGGPVKCFNIEISGSSGGNSVRIGFKQGSNDSDVAPYVDIAAFANGYSNKICFADAMCPDWAATQGCTKATGDVGTPFDLQVQVSAGATAAAVGAYDLCLTKIEPIVEGGSGSTGTGGAMGSASTCKNPAGQGTITDPFGVGMVSCDKKQYVVQNNDWGAKMGETISYGTGTKMKVTQQTGSGSNNNPASFPSIFIGQNSSHSSGDAPKAVKDIAAGGLPTSWTWAANGATGSYNAAYDVWFSTGSGGEPSASSPSGGFLMVWLHKPSDNQPIGTMMKSVKIAGVNWNIWEGNNSGNGKPCITYQAATDVMSLSFNLGDFIRDAVDNQKYLMNSWYLTNVFAGFEIWDGGQGLETVDFTATMQ